MLVWQKKQSIKIKELKIYLKESRMEQFLLKKVRRNKTRQAMSDMLKIIRRKEIW